MGRRRTAGITTMVLAVVTAVAVGCTSAAEPTPTADPTVRAERPDLRLVDDGLPASRFLELPVAEDGPRSQLYLFTESGQPIEDALGIAVLDDPDAEPASAPTDEVGQSMIGDLRVASRQLPSGEMVAAVSRVESDESLARIVTALDVAAGQDPTIDLDDFTGELIGTGAIDAPFLGPEANLLTDTGGYAWLHKQPGNEISSVMVSVQDSDPRTEQAYAWFRGEEGVPSDVAEGATLWAAPEAIPGQPPPLEVTFVAWRSNGYLVIVDCRVDLSADCERLAKQVQSVSDAEFREAADAVATTTSAPEASP